MNNLKNITEVNIEEKIDSMKKLIQNWLYRNITSIGRICIVKSLIMSKVIHVLQALPSPSKEYFKSIETIFINFVWKNKRHEINKKLIGGSIEQGGLNMISLEEMDKGLKLTWIRNLVTQDTEWLDLAKKYKIDRLLFTDTDYHNILEKKHKKNFSFWKSVVTAYKRWYIKVKETITINAEDQPLWGNTFIKMPFNTHLYTKKIFT